MDYLDRERILYDIIVGKYYYGKYELVPNTSEEIFDSHRIYRDFIDNNKYSAYIDPQALQFHLNRLGIWTFQNEEDLKKLENSLENLKVSLFENQWNTDLVKKTKKRIEQIKSGILKSYQNKYTFQQETLNYQASLMKKRYLIAMGIRYKGKRVYSPKTFLKKNSFLIDRFISIVDNHIITVEQYREIARTEPFRSMWNSSKYKMFKRNVSELTENQRVLISFAKMYDGVYRHPECPNDNVISDDDMLDGWLIKQNRERKDKQKNVAFDDKFAHMKNKNGKQELFVMAGSAEEAQSVYNLNDARGREVIKARNQAISRHGEVSQMELPDVRMDLQMQATQETRQIMRNM